MRLATLDELLNRLEKKGAEFYQCAAHMHMRGMGEVMDECRPIVEEMKKEGKSFDDVLKHFESLNKGPIDLQKDLFLKNIGTLFATKGGE